MSVIGYAYLLKSERVKVMERLIYYGCVFTGQKKSNGETYYAINYLDASTGKCKTDWSLTYDQYKAIESQHIEVGTLCTGEIYLDDNMKGYVGGIKL